MRNIVKNAQIELATTVVDLIRCFCLLLKHSMSDATNRRENEKNSSEPPVKKARLNSHAVEGEGNNSEVRT